MENQNKRKRRFGALFTLLFLVLQAFIPLNVSAQKGCSVVVGGTDFVDKSHSDTLWAGDFNLLETKGPDGSVFGSDNLAHADSAQQLTNNYKYSAYGVTTNTTIIDSTYNEVENALVMHVASNEANPGNLLLFTYKVDGLKPGSDYEVSFTVTLLNGPDNELAKELTKAFKLGQAGISVYTNPDSYGNNGTKPAMTDAELSFNGKYEIPVTIKGTLKDNEDAVTLYLKTNYNFSAGLTLAMSNLTVKGCYAPRVTSNQGLSVCQGEQALFALDKEYNASSYKWMMKEPGGSYTEVGTGKSIYKELKQKGTYSVYCSVNGIDSDPIEIATKVCCVDNDGNAMSRLNVFNEDFGYFSDPHTYEDSKGKVTTTPATYAPERADVSWDLTTDTKMKFDFSGQINDGYYGVVVPRAGGGYYQNLSGQSMATWMNGVKSDHSSLETGKKGGAALFMNVTENYTGVIFTRVIEGLCAEKEIFFETYIANMSNGSEPEVTINIKDKNTKKILATSKATAVKNAGWIRVSIEGLKVPADSKDVILEVLSTGGEGDLSGQFWQKGNDLIIDDIRFMVCSPPSVDIYSNDYSFAADTTICGDGKIKIGAQASDMLKKFFGGSPSYLYQTSTDGKTWKNMGGITSDDVYTVNTKDYPGETNYFRVVVATEGGLKQFIENPSDANYEDPCRNYSISKTFTVIRAGSIDMGEDEEYSECGGVVIPLNGSNDGTLVRFEWFDANNKMIGKEKKLEYEVTEDETVLVCVGYNKEECSGRREFTIKKNPTVEFELDSTMVCDLTTVSAKKAPAGTEFVWTYGGEALSETGASVEIDATNEDATITAVGNATGYCESVPVELEVKVRRTADLPKTTDGDRIEFQVKKTDFSLASMVKEVETLQWSLSETGPWSDDAPKQSLAEAGEFVHYVRTMNDDGCPSEPIALTVVVNAAPMPGVRNDTVCVGTDVDFTKYITKTDDGFSLVWYATEEGEGAKSPKSEKARYGGRVLEYWVTQKSAQAESEKAHIEVLVAKVAEPVVDKKAIDYCIGADATELTATISADEPANIFATGVEWRLDDKVVENPVPSTDKEGETTYKAYGYFEHPNTLNGDAVCYSNAVDVTVKIIEVKEPTSKSDFKVNYLKTDGESGGFKDILAQSENKVAIAETGNSLVWYDENKNKMTGTPKPTYSADMGDESFTYYVSQKMNAEPGCESKLVKVTVTVSASPRPTTSSVAYCEGATGKSLETSVTINTLDGESESDYTLVWFESDPSNLSDEQKIATGSTTAPVAKTTVSSGLFEVHTYYVAQMKTNEAGQKVISGVSELIDSVYARPKLKMTDPDPVCEPQTVDLTDKKYWDVEAAQIWVKALKDGDIEDAKAIAESGTYQTEAYFLVRGEECRTKQPANVNVTVDYIRGLAIDGVPTTCPNTTVDLTAKTDSYSPSAITYYWSSKDEEKSTTDKTYTTPSLSTATTYSLSAKAGACDVKAEDLHTIEIGDGPVAGTVSFSEDGLDPASAEASYVGVEFNSCGQEATINANVISTKEDFVWTLNGSKVGTGKSLKVTPKDGTSVYHVTYTNDCPTGFDVTINSVPVTATLAEVTDMVICEGESFKAVLNVKCSKDDYKVQWFQDGRELGETSKTLEFPDATADLNGKYTYLVSYNDLCKSDGEVKKGDIEELKVRPYVKFDYTSYYVARKDSMLSIPLTFSVPSDKDPSNILWSEGGRSVNEGSSYDLKVKSDHKFKITVSDDDYCSNPVEIKVLVDARLKLNVTGTSVICLNDDSEIVIDTAGTGKFVYGDKAGIKITQISPTVSERVYESGWEAVSSDYGKLHFKIHPAEVGVTTYRVEYFYRKGDGVDAQSIIKEYNVEVRQSPNIVPTRGLAMCANGDEQLTVSLASIYPATGVSLEWDDDPDIISSRTGQEIAIRPTFDDNASGNSYRLKYTVRANLDGDICDAVVTEVDVTVYRPLEGLIEGPEAICAGLSTELDASSYNADTYTWTAIPEDASISDASAAKIEVGPASSTEYTVVVNRGECSATSSFDLEISERPVIQGVDSVDYNIRDIIVIGGREPYTFWLDKKTGKGQEDDNRFTGVRYGRHTVYVVDDAKCDAKKSFSVLAPSIKIQPVVSPNGDGVYDAFFNNVLHDAFPNAKVTIYDRWGKKLVTYSGSDPGWDGTYNGSPMPSTDYWYEIEIKELNTIYTGHFTLMRQ